jgi:hypothetical protein
VRKPWISEATSGSRLPAPPAMAAAAELLLLLSHTVAALPARGLSQSWGRKTTKDEASANGAKSKRRAVKKKENISEKVLVKTHNNELIKQQ